MEHRHVPTLTFLPIVSGWPGSTCRMQPSWSCEFSPIVITSLSPRTTQLNQMLALFSSTTEPITIALSAIQ
jgi:hypothetical protein